MTGPDPADLPLWARRLHRQAQAPSNGHQAAQGGPGARPGTAAAYASAAMASELAALGAQTEPGRNERTNEVTFKLAQLVAAGHLAAAPTYDAIRLTALGTGLPTTEVDKTMRSAIAAGEAQPRQVDETAQPHEVPEATVLDDPGDPGDESPGRVLVHVDWHEAYTAPTVQEWVVEPLIPARRLVALFSPAKAGKSLLMLELAVAISLGKPVMSASLDRPRRVLYVDFENDVTGDVVPRLRAMGYTDDDLDEVKYLAFPDLAYLDTYIGGLELTNHCDEHSIEVVVIDTISRAVVGEENDNDTWLGFYKHTGVQLKKRGIACVRLDHTGKDLTKGMRGGSAKYSDVDVAWQLTPVTADTLRLECVANRLPITEKVLLLRRELDPLRHEVSTDRMGDVLAAEELEWIAVWERLDTPRHPDPDHPGHWGMPRLRRLLLAQGYPEKVATERRVKAAMARWYRPDHVPQMHPYLDGMPSRSEGLDTDPSRGTP